MVVLKRFGFAVLVIFALIGMGFTGVFAAMQFGLLNIRGTIVERNQFFGSVPKVTTSTSCVTHNDDGSTSSICPWNQAPEWEVVKAGLAKDEAVIDDVAHKTDVSPRMLAAIVIPEQLRFFTSERETYKKFFEPLKILGSMSQFSLGVTGIKQDTAKMIERNLVDNNSDFYPGSKYADLVAYPAGSAHDSVLYSRLTDSRNHYYDYIYSALYIKEVEAQWRKRGYDISGRPDILVTLFNIGFAASKPKDSPQMGGSEITLNNKKYTFGELGTLFYQSDELKDEFPRQP